MRLSWQQLNPAAGSPSSPLECRTAQTGPLAARPASSPQSAMSTGNHKNMSACTSRRPHSSMQMLGSPFLAAERGWGARRTLHSHGKLETWERQPAIMRGAWLRPSLDKRPAHLRHHCLYLGAHFAVQPPARHAQDVGRLRPGQPPLCKGPPGQPRVRQAHPNQRRCPAGAASSWHGCRPGRVPAALSAASAHCEQRSEHLLLRLHGEHQRSSTCRAALRTSSGRQVCVRRS